MWGSGNKAIGFLIHWHFGILSRSFSGVLKGVDLKFATAQSGVVPPGTGHRVECEDLNRGQQRNGLDLSFQPINTPITFRTVSSKRLVVLLHPPDDGSVNAKAVQ